MSTKSKKKKYLKTEASIQKHLISHFKKHFKKCITIPTMSQYRIIIDHNINIILIILPSPNIKQILLQVFLKMCITYFWNGDNTDYRTEKLLNLWNICRLLLITRTNYL